MRVDKVDNLSKYCSFIYNNYYKGFVFRDALQYDDGLWLKLIDNALRALNFKDRPKILGEIA